MQSYYWYGLGCNDKLLNCCANVDLSSIPDETIEILSKPVIDNKNRRIAAPDLRKERQFELCEELLRPKYSVNGFKTSELKKAFSQNF